MRLHWLHTRPTPLRAFLYVSACPRCSAVKSKVKCYCADFLDVFFVTVNIGGCSWADWVGVGADKHGIWDTFTSGIATQKRKDFGGDGLYDRLRQREGELRKCESTVRTNHSRCSPRHCNVQLHMRGGAHQATAKATAEGTYLCGGYAKGTAYSTQTHRSGFRGQTVSIIKLLFTTSL